MDLGLDFEGRSKKGQLKIFFVFSAGFGKTYAKKSYFVFVIILLKLIPNM